jgi:hypothetical protein
MQPDPSVGSLIGYEQRSRAGCTRGRRPWFRGVRGIRVPGVVPQRPCSDGRSQRCRGSSAERAVAHAPAAGRDHGGSGRIHVHGAREPLPRSGIATNSAARALSTSASSQTGPRPMRSPEWPTRAPRDHARDVAAARNSARGARLPVHVRPHSRRDRPGVAPARGNRTPRERSSVCESCSNEAPADHRDQPTHSASAEDAGQLGRNGTPRLSRFRRGSHHDVVRHRGSLPTTRVPRFALSTPSFAVYMGRVLSKT